MDSGLGIERRSNRCRRTFVSFHLLGPGVATSPPFSTKSFTFSSTILPLAFTGNLLATQDADPNLAVLLPLSLTTLRLLFNCLLPPCFALLAMRIRVGNHFVRLTSLTSSNSSL